MTERQGPFGERRPESGPAPWWSTGRVRLPVLLVCLALTVFVLVGTGASGTLGGPSDTSTDRACSHAATTPLQRVDWDRLLALRASVLAVMAPLARTRYAFGSVAPEDAWSDASPQRLSSTAAAGSWPASYEMRGWVSDPELAPRSDDLVADVFQFPDPAQALRFFAAASATRCHRDGRSPAAAQPPEARNLTWVNPDDVTEEDVFLLRGRRVYRVAEVRPPQQPGYQQLAGVRRVDAIACGLPDAHCGRARSS
jgi:hypothetical protein